METKSKQLDNQTKQQKHGSGSLLADARKKQNRTVEEIADELNLSVTQIKTIELDQNEGLPEPTYVRGYIRSYANLLGLDAEQVLESYLNPNWQKTSSLDDMPKGIGNADDGGSSSFLSAGKVVAGLLIIIVGAFLWFSGLITNLIDSTLSSTTDDTTIVEPQVQTIVSEPTSPLIEQAPDTVDNVLVNVESVAENVAADGGSSDTVEPSSPAVDVEPVSDVKHSLTLTFIQTCWVDIRDSNDKRLAFKSYSAGEELSVSNDGRLHVFLGNAEGVRAIYNGEPFDMKPYREGVYAKFSLGKK